MRPPCVPLTVMVVAAAAGVAGAPATHHATVSATPRPGASQRRNPACQIAIMPAPLSQYRRHQAGDQPCVLRSESARRWSVMLEAAFIEARQARPVNPALPGRDRPRAFVKGQPW